MRNVLSLSFGVLAGASMLGAAYAESTGELQEVVVTAQKRSENLQDVPIAVSVVTAGQLARFGVADVVDMKVAVPSINVFNNAGYLGVSLRGIGTNGFGAGFENPIALYVDGVYYAATSASVLTLNNVEQIEVLKGPQGTLFGRNATGGLIQIITKTPTDKTTGEFNVNYGNYNTISGNGYIAGPVADNLFMDVAVSGSRQGDGWGTDRFDGSDVYRTYRDINVRSKLVFELSAATRFTLIGDYSDNKNSDQAYSIYPGTLSGFQPALGVLPSQGYDNSANLHDLTEIIARGVSLRWDQKIGDLDFTSLSAYRRSKFHNVIDYDTQPQSVEDIDPFFQFDDQKSQELQLASKSGGKLTWLVGAYYIDSHSKYDPLTIDLFGSPFLTILNGEQARAWAGYAQGTYELFDRTNLTLGGRYTSEKRSTYDTSEDLLGTSFQLPSQSETFRKFTYRASLDHRFSDEVLAYASVNRGFKSGGYGLESPGGAPFRPEILDAYEIGMKTDVFDRRVRVNAAAFYYHYKDIQVQEFVQSLANLINGAGARVTGLDSDFEIQVSPEFSLLGGLTVIDPKFTSFDNCPFSSSIGGTPVQQSGHSCKGNLLPFASKFTGSVGGNYATHIGSGSLDLNANLYYSSGFYAEADNVIKQKSYPLLNASVRYELSNGFSVGAFGKNLTNERIINQVATPVNGTHVGTWQAPRTYGVSLGYEF